MFIAVYCMAYSPYNGSSWCVICFQCVSISFSWFVTTQLVSLTLTLTLSQ